MTAEKRGKKRKAESQRAEENAQDEALSFASFGLEGRLLKAILNQYEKPTLVQAAAIPLAVNGRDIVARAKTGSGKTAAYVIPIIHHALTRLVCSLPALLMFEERRR
jgi:superfamily II DNA/RNA helicase